ncbi:hypothetical protein Aperf_G00000092683 [Anoplocephala perfoliata]
MPVVVVIASATFVPQVWLSIRQYTVICLPNASHYKCNVAEINSEEGFPIWPSQTGWCKVYRLCPLLEDNRDKSGLALDGDLKNEDTTLASSTIRSCIKSFGIVVQYKVKIRLILGFCPSDVCLELLFILIHPNPEPNLEVTEGGPSDNGSSGGEGGGITTSSPLTLQPTSNGGSSTVAVASNTQMSPLAKRAAAVAATNGISQSFESVGDAGWYAGVCITISKTVVTVTATAWNWLSHGDIHGGCGCAGWVPVGS